MATIFSTGILVSINGINLKDLGIRQPDDLGIEKYDLSKSGRLASGKMTIDIIAKKVKLTLVWDVISGIDMQNLLLAVDTLQSMFPVTYIENGITYTKTFYSGAKKAKRFRTDGVWYWKNFTFDLIEE